MADTKPAHSPIGASSMYRWATCPGSVKMSEGKPDVAGKAALEGTAAHEIVGLALERGFSENKDAYKILSEQIEHLKVYTDYVQSLKGPDECHIEHSFDMSDIYPGLYGTADCVKYERDKRTLHVIDYKNGVALPVEVEGNLQLQYYALGALTTLNYPCEFVTMTIVQPRCYHPAGPVRSWTVQSLHFLDFEAQLIAAAKDTQKRKTKLVAGEHCVFCPAKLDCPEKQSGAVGEAKKQFNHYKDPALEFKAVGTGNVFDLD